MKEINRLEKGGRKSIKRENITLLKLPDETVSISKR
jgi:hypothetical protein